MLLVTLVVSVCLAVTYVRRSRTKALEVPVDEDQFKRDNVVDYNVEGGGEEDINDEVFFRDILQSFEDGYTSIKRVKREIPDSGNCVITPKAGTSCDRAKLPHDAYCACSEPLKVEMKCSCCVDDASPNATSCAQVHFQKQDTPGIRRRDPEGREGGEDQVNKDKDVHSCGLDETVCRERKSPEGHDSRNMVGNQSRRKHNSATCHSKPRAAATQSVPDTPSPLDFLPTDAMQFFSLEGYGSPTISLSTLGNSDIDEEGGEFPWQRSVEMKDKFEKLAKIYGSRTEPLERLSWN